MRWPDRQRRQRTIHNLRARHGVIGQIQCTDRAVRDAGAGDGVRADTKGISAAKHKPTASGGAINGVGIRLAKDGAVGVNLADGLVGGARARNAALDRGGIHGDIVGCARDRDARACGVGGVGVGVIFTNDGAIGVNLANR